MATSLWPTLSNRGSIPGATEDSPCRGVDCRGSKSSYWSGVKACRIASVVFIFDQGSLKITSSVINSPCTGIRLMVWSKSAWGQGRDHNGGLVSLSTQP
ncbi:hypothetical protein TNCV_4908811 [Trichonephila clavipes]|uniref:Uncharacterized protein n=1 Tax=Trichonephila clavipes TaxID=2585209 RepID=A0A8X6V8D2_TRICX|nr:hypothetical protein TNCV_4908811 [Trichonephila clavipes]